MNITFRQLSLFEAIARLSSLTKASNEQAISQSAASQSIKELEKQLGYALFRKAGRSLTLTEAGQAALLKIKPVLANIESLKFPESGIIGGKLRICASETIGSYLLPQLLADFTKLHPRVEPELDIQNTETVIQKLTQGQASIGFIEGPAHHPEIVIDYWREDRLVVFCAPFDPLAAAEVIEDQHLAIQPWIVREYGSGTRAVFDQSFESRKQSANIRLALTRQEAIKQSVRAGLGVGCLSELAVSDELQAKSLIKLSTTLNLNRTFSMVQVKQLTAVPLHQHFIAFSKAWNKTNVQSNGLKT